MPEIACALRKSAKPRTVKILAKPSQRCHGNPPLVSRAGLDRFHRSSVSNLSRLPGLSSTTYPSANRASLPVVLITNQEGIGRGYYGWAEFRAVQQRILADLAAEGGALDVISQSVVHSVPL